MLEAELANADTKYKIRVYTQAIVYVKRQLPKTEMQTLPSGLTVQAQNWYDEHECQQLAVNYNGLYIREADLDKLIDQLGKALKQSMRDKGIIT